MTPPLRALLPRGFAAPSRIPSSTRLFTNSTILPATVSPTTPTAAGSHPPTQPPSHRAATSRKTYLHRLYVSLLRSSPLLVFFQHNNLVAAEWSALRRELASALQKAGVDEDKVVPRMTNIHSGIFGVALRNTDSVEEEVLKAPYAASKLVQEKTRALKKEHPLKDIISGPLGVISFGEVDPLALKTALDVVFPERGKFKKGLDPAAVSGAQKLVMLAARVDGRGGKILDQAGVKWVAGLGGVDQLRGQLVAMLQSVGGGELVRALESVGLSAVRTVEGRRKMMEEEANPKAEGETKAEA